MQLSFGWDSSANGITYRVYWEIFIVPSASLRYYYYYGLYSIFFKIENANCD